MATRELIIGMVFSSQTTVGVLGNFSLLYHYLTLCFTTGRLRSTDLILSHLTIANTMVILTKGISQTMSALGWKNFLNDLGCKVLFYIHRVGRGVSFGSTCLLSIFQAVTVSPGNCRWAELKVKAPKCAGSSLVPCWLLHVLVNTIFPMYLTSKWSNKSITSKKDHGYCSSVRHDKTAESLYAALLAFPDVVSLGLMLWASGSMVFILYRHKQRAQHIHRNVSLRSSPETRATQTILVLLSTFVCFYTLCLIFQVFMSAFYHPAWWLVNTAAVTDVCYPTVSPFILMNRHSSVSRLHSPWIRKTKFPHIIRNS